MKKETKVLLWLLGAMYFAQGLSTGIFHTSLFQHMLAAGVKGKEYGGVMTIALLPWIWKFIAGPFLDRFGGYRLGVIVASTVAMVTLGMTNLIEPPTLKWMTLIVFIHSAATAYGDVAIDGWVLALTSRDERGAVQAVTRIFKTVGLLIGGGGLILLSGYFPWSSYVVVAACLTGLPTIIAIFGKLKSPPREMKTTWRETFGILKKLLTLTSIIAAAVAVLSYIHAVTMWLVQPWFTSVIRCGKDEIGAIELVGVAFGVVGAIAGTRITKIFETQRRKALLTGTVVLSVTYVIVGMFMRTLSPIGAGDIKGLTFLMAMVGVVDGLYAVTLGTFFMDITQKITKGKGQTTVYAVFMALISLSLLTIFPQVGMSTWEIQHAPMAVIYGGALQLLILIPLRWFKHDRK